MAITKVINDAVDLNQTSDYSGLRLPVGTTGNVVESFTTDYLVVGGGGGGARGYAGGGGAGGLRTSYNNSTTTTNSLSFPSGKTAIATYMLDNNATDISGNYNGTEVNITYNTGEYGGAAVFNGSSSKIEVSNPVIPNGASSISFWYNPEGSTGTEYILGQGVATASKGVTVYWYNQSFGALVAKGTSSLAGSATGSTTYSTTSWHNVVFTWDGTSSSNAFKVYVNGSLLVEGTSDTSSSSIGTYTNFAIGGLQGGTFASGKIDQVRIYNTALSSTDVSNIYNNEVQANSGGGTAAESSLTLTAGVAYDVTVGQGGAGVTGNGVSGSGANGQNSIFYVITSNGGGGGGDYNNNSPGVQNGGAGGGGGAEDAGGVSGNGTINQGYDGGVGSTTGIYRGGGGGGAEGVGIDGSTSGNGGSAVSINIIGSATAYAGGGGGGLYSVSSGNAGSGGSNIGGDGAKGAVNAESGTNNTGSGGGGAGGVGNGYNGGGNAGDGGSGVVILRYPTASVSSFTTTGTLNTPSTTDTLASATYPITNTAYYKLDGDAADSSGNGYNGAASNVTWQNGRFGQAAVFNGSNSVFDTNLSVPTNWTVSLWLKRTPNGYFGGTTNNLARSGVYFYANSDGKIQVYNRNSSGGNIDTLSTSTGLVTEGNWHHIAITFDSTSGTGLTTVYVDSINAGTLDGTPTHSTDFKFGRSGDYAVEYFNGSIDQMRIFDSALTSNQVTQLYEEHYQTKFTDGSDTAIVFTEGTGTVTFSGVDPASPQGALRTNTSYSEDGSASVIEHYNGTDWKYFDAIKYCTTNTLNFPSGAGCIASYNLDNNVNDIGNTYNGTNSNVTFTASGKFGAAAVFNGSSSRIDNSSISSQVLNDYTISFWAKWNSTPTAQEGLMGIYQPSTSNGTTMSFANGIFLINTGNSQNQLNLSSGFFSANQWYHIALSHIDGGDVILYVNNNVEGTISNINNTINSSSLLRLGLSSRTSSGSYNYNQYFNGSIDQVRIFNDSLTSDEVSKLYNNEIACS